MTLSMSDSTDVEFFMIEAAIYYQEYPDVSKLSYNLPLSCDQQYRVLLGDDAIGMATQMDGMIRPTYYDNYALISPQLNSQEELWTHVNYSGNEILSINATDHTMRLRIRTDDTGDDIDVLLTTSENLAYRYSGDIIHTIGDMDSSLEQIKKESDRLRDLEAESRMF